MNEKMINTINQFKTLLFCGIVILTTQYISLKGNLNVINAILGMLIIAILSIVALKIKENIPIKIPAFAWASLLSLLLTLPWSPVQGIILELIKEISAGQIGTVILTFAGVSIGLKLNDVKKLSWKIVIVAFVVFLGTFFGSATISHFVLKFQGLI